MAWDKKDKAVFASIALAMKSSEQEHIYSCKTAKEAWDHLKEVYQGKGMHRLLSLMRSLAWAKLSTNVSGKGQMKEYIRGVMQTADEIAEIGHKLDNPIVMGFILNGLPDSYRYLVVNLESQLEEISIQDLSALLVDEEIRISSRACGLADAYGREYPRNYQAALARKQACKHCGKDNHLSERCFRNMEHCEYCGKSVHDEDGCFTKQFREKKKNGGKSSGGKTEPYGMVMAYESDG